MIGSYAILGGCGSEVRGAHVLRKEVKRGSCSWKRASWLGEHVPITALRLGKWFHVLVLQRVMEIGENLNAYGEKLAIELSGLPGG